jgi:hypothetical protein
MSTDLEYNHEPRPLFKLRDEATDVHLFKAVKWLEAEVRHMKYVMQEAKKDIVSEDYFSAGLRLRLAIERPL